MRVRGAPSRSLSLAEAAAAAGDGDGLAAAGGFTPPGVTFASGTHFAVVEVDPWTGSVRVLRYLVVHDCGRVINPMIVEAQVAGGVAQGIGGALPPAIARGRRSRPRPRPARAGLTLPGGWGLRLLFGQLSRGTRQRCSSRSPAEPTGGTGCYGIGRFRTS